MRQRRPYDALEVVVIDLEVETATLVAIHQASREALVLRTECKTRHILDIGQTLDRRPGGEVVLEAAHELTVVVKYDNIELEVLDDKSNKANFMGQCR
jgi:hypothetical protein